jgi:hypothetical protein
VTANSSRMLGANVVPIRSSNFSEVDGFNRVQVVSSRPHRLEKAERGWVLVADGVELLDLRDAMSEREAAIRGLRWLSDNVLVGPDVEAGDVLQAAAELVRNRPENHQAVRRLALLLEPGISEFHERYAELLPIFARLRDGDQLDRLAIDTLIQTAQEEAFFLRTGKV